MKDNPEKYKKLKQLEKADTVNEIQLPQTKEDNEKIYSAAQRERAKTARRLYHTIGTPSVRNFKYIVRSNQIRNCPITVEDIIIAKDIYGKDISYIKGQTTRRNPTTTMAMTIAIPKELKDKHRDIKLYMDTMFINRVSFLTLIVHPMYH